MRRGALAACLLLALALPVRADEPAAPALAAEDWPLLPINDVERQELARDHPDLVREATSLGARIRKLVGMRAARKDPDDPAARALAEQEHELRARLAPLLARAVEALDDEAVDARLLARIRAVPPGPLRATRHAMGLVTFVEDVPEEPRALLAYVLPRVEGALLALEDEAVRRELERRYWRLVDYVLPEAPRAALHRRLPTSHQKSETALQHLFLLPGLSASQAVRLRGVLEEVQAQASPDQALVKRLQGEQGDGAGARRREIQAATHRLLALQRWAGTQAREILTPAQWQAFEAIPPRVRVEDRKATSVDLLKGLTLTDAQRARLATMRDGLREVRETYRRRRAEAAGGMQAMDPDDPAMAAAQMEMAGAEADANVEQRRFNGRVLLELLRPDQVVAWVLAPAHKQR